VTAHLEAAGATVVRAEAPCVRAHAVHAKREAPGVRSLGDGGPEDEAGALDGAFAEVDDWGLARPRATGLAERLAPGAPVLVRLRRAPGQPVRRVLADLGPAFLLRPAASLGLVVPAETSAGWAERYPQAFGVLCALEGATRSWPLLRDAGREALLLGAFRGAAR
jgi:hypothetical protein